MGRLAAVAVLAFILLQPGPTRAEPKAAWQFSTPAPIISSPVCHDGRVYFGGLDSVLYAVQMETGLLQWRFQTRGEIRSTALVYGSHVYLTGGDGHLYALDAASGETRWDFASEGEKKHDFADYYQSSPVESNGAIFSTPLVTGGYLVVTSTDGRVYAFRL